ncbi:MAG: HAD-IA family hydrolase [Nitriliruptoraceae bacterium]
MSGAGSDGGDGPADGRVAPDTVVFDVGEVVIDETRVWSVWAELVGVSPLSFAAVLGAGIVQGEPLAAVFAHLAPNLAWQELESEHEQRYGGFRDDDLYPDVRPCLEELTASGVQVLIAGNQPARRRPQLEALGLSSTHVRTSEEFGAEKPDPGFFTAMLSLAERDDPGRVLYVGDRVDNDVLAAQAAGVRTCWLRRGPWGQLQDLPEDAEEPDLVLEGLGELPLLLHSWRQEQR